MAVRYYCPKCWRDYAEDVPVCPGCGLDVHRFMSDKDYVGKLIGALVHPEPETPIRAAWILGNLHDERAVEPLINLIGTTQDVYIACAAVEALGKLGTARARQFLKGIAGTHPAAMVRDAATAAASDNSESVERTA